jgi:hypothetical protein
MVVHVDTTDERAVTGFVLSLGAADWVRFQTADDGYLFGVPTGRSTGGFRAASTCTCSCNEHQSVDVRCAHIWAVRFHLLREQGEVFVLAPPQPAPGTDFADRHARDAITDAEGSDVACLGCPDARCLHVYWANDRVLDRER